MEQKEKKGFFAEFKKFISRGNVVDLAVGMIIGSTFTKIVTSMVNDILMPIIGLLNPNGFTGMYVGLVKNGVATADTTLANGAIIAQGETVYKSYLYYGNFIQTVLDFILVALVLFLIVKGINKVHDYNIKQQEKLKTRLTKNQKEEKTENIESIDSAKKEKEE